MIRLYTFGALDLRNGDNASYAELVRQHKRIALLAYLAIEHRGRFCRRDTLLGVFWPELDTSSARNALSQALHFIRRIVGSDIVISRGHEEVGVDAACLACDAVEFRALLDAGQLESALGLYTGDLLPGLFLPDAPEFERWLETERTALRALAMSAAWKLSDAAERTNRLRAAIDWAQRARSLAPSDETGFRRLINLLDRAGNRAIAIAEYDAFVEHLSAELELEPSPETRALIDRIRARAGPRAVSVSRDSSEHILVGRITGETSGDGSDAPRGLPLPSGPISRFAVGTSLVAAMIIVAIALLADRSRGGAADLPRPRAVAVLPFTVRGDARYHYLGAGVADLLSAQLADGGTIRSADTHAVLGLATKASDSAVRPDRARDIAHRVGADGFVLGSLVEIAGRIQLDASLYDLHGNVLARAHAGPVDEHDVFNLVDDLAGRLFAERPGPRGSDLVRVAEATTSSLVALTAFLEGESDFRVGRYVESVAAFQRAVAADSSFAIAYYRLGIAHIWAGGDALAPMIAAQRFARRLPRHQRQLVDAGIAWLHGENTNAEHAYRAIVARYPDDVEARNQLVEILFHTNAARGRDPIEAVDACHHVLQLDPENANAVWHLALLSAQNRPAFDSLTRRALALGPDAHHSLDIRSLRAYLIGDSVERARMARELATMNDPAFTEVVALRAAVFGAEPMIARDIMATAVFDRDAASRAEGAQRRARYDAAAGRIAEARRDIAEIRALHFGTYAMERATLDLLPYATPSRDELLAAERDLAAWDAGSDHSRPYVSVEREYYDALRLHFLVRLGARLGDAAGTQQHLGEFARLSRGNRASMIDALAQSARAFVLAERGEPSAALIEIDSAYREVWYPWAGESAPQAQAADRFLRAELLEQLGRDDEALRWYASADRNSLDDVGYLAISHIRRAAIYDRQGKLERAVVERHAAARVWRVADPMLVSSR